MRRRIPFLHYGVGVLSAALVVFAACSRDLSLTAPAKHLVAHVPSRAVGTTVSGATLVTNKDDYLPGDTLKLSGAGWQAGDTLDVVLDETPQNHPPVNWAIAVGADGTFADSTYVVQQSDAGVTFKITATSRAAGESAQATFTDGSVTFNSSPVAVSGLKYAVTSANSTCSAAPTFTTGSSPQTISFSGGPGNYPACTELRAPTSVTVASTNYSFKQWTTTALACSGSALDTTQDVVGTEQRLEFVACGSGTTGTVTAVYQTITLPVLTISKTANNAAGCTDNTGDPDFCYNVNATYTITVSNAGAATSGTVTVTDTLPSQLTYANSTAGDWTCGAVLQVVTCTTSAVIAATSGTKDLTLNVTPNTVANDVVNRASVQGGGDDTPASSTNAQVDIQGASLTITKAGNNDAACTNNAGDPDFCLGTEATYTITVTNSGLAATSGTVTVTDTLPSQLTYVNSSVAGVWSCGAALQIVTCTTTDVIAASGNKTLTLKVTPNTVANDVVNRASVQGGGDNSAASSTSAQVDIQGPNLTIAKLGNNNAACTDNAGDPDFCYNVEATYTITITNNGLSATSGTVTVTDTLPSQLTYVNSSVAGVWSCSAALQIVTCSTTDVIAAGGNKVLTLKVTPNTAANDVVNRASVKGGGDITDASSANAQVDIQGPNLTITKAGNNATACTDNAGDPDFCFGTQATYTITITNSGLAATSGTVTVTDTLPSQLTYVNSSVAGVWSCSAALQIVTCTTTDVIAAAGNKVLTLKVTPNTVANDVVNRASVKGGGDVTDASSTNAQVDIKPAPTTSALTVAPSTQQYSDTTILADTITPYELLTSQLTGTVYFYVGSSAQTCGTSAPAGSVGNVSIADADNGVAQFRYMIDKAPGSYKVTACFYSSNGNFANSSDNKDLTVTQEDATVSSLAFSPDPVQVSSPGGTASATITFQVKETKPEKNTNTALAGPGDLNNATIDLDLVAIGNGANSQNNLSCSSSFSGSGYAQVRSVTCNVTGLAADTYDVQVTIGNYYIGSGDIVMTVTDPSLGFATGGGWYTMGNGDRVNFGFEVKATVNKNKTVYQGSLLVIRHMGTDIIKVKSNVFDGYAIQKNTVTFSGKATYSVNGVSIGNYAYAAYAEDNATSGANADKFSLYLALTGNQVATAPSLTNLITNAVLLSAGNIQVPQPQGGK